MNTRTTKTRFISGFFIFCVIFHVIFFQNVDLRKEECDRKIAGVEAKNGYKMRVYP